MIWIYSYSYNHLTRTFFVIHSAMALISVPVGSRPCYDSDVVYSLLKLFVAFRDYEKLCPSSRHRYFYLACEPEIPTDPIVERLILVERENEYLKEELERIEGEKMELELYVADVVDDHKMKMNAMRLKMDAMRLKLQKIRKICH